MMDVKGYSEAGNIVVVIDGQEWVVPDDPLNGMRRDIAAWESAGNTIPPYNPSPATLADAIAERLAELDAYRWEREVGGVEFAGATLRTDANSQAKVAAAYTGAKLDPTYSVPTWEVAPGVFMPLDNATIIAMGEAVRDHVQATFNRKAELHAEISALPTLEAALAFDVAEAW